MAGHHIGIALLVRLPGDGGLSLGLLWHSRLIAKGGADGHVQLQDGQSAALCIRKGQKDQWLTNLPIGRLWVASVPIISVVSIVVVFCILHTLALTTMTILAIVASYLDRVVEISFRHIQGATRTSRAAGWRKGKQGVWV